MTDQSLQQTVTDVENDLLDLIVASLKVNNINVDEAKKLAKEFLSFLPMQDKHDLLEKLHTFSVDHNETQGLYLKYAKPLEEEDRQRKLSMMSEHIKNGQIEHALTVAKGGVDGGITTTSTTG